MHGARVTCGNTCAAACRCFKAICLIHWKGVLVQGGLVDLVRNYAPPQQAAYQATNKQFHTCNRVLGALQDNIDFWVMPV